MVEPHWNELRNLKPGLRRGFLEGQVRYRDQKREVRFEEEHDRRMEMAGVVTHSGGERASKHTGVLVRDTIRRNLHIALPAEG